MLLVRLRQLCKIEKLFLAEENRQGKKKKIKTLLLKIVSEIINILIRYG